jgi:hypothetical protein
MSPLLTHGGFGAIIGSLAGFLLVAGNAALRRDAASTHWPQMALIVLAFGGTSAGTALGALAGAVIAALRRRSARAQTPIW